MLVYFSGEDEVTKLVAKRLVRFCLNSFSNEPVEFEDANFRDYGTKALESMPRLVALGNAGPVISVFDSDNDCIKNILTRFSPQGWKSQYGAINIAYGEAENWLASDRSGFARYLRVNVDRVPSLDKRINEVVFPYKASLFIINELAPSSKNEKIRRSLYSDRPNKKPSTYNSVWPNYITRYWDINEALANSSTLSQAINRITNALMNYSNR